MKCRYLGPLCLLALLGFAPCSPGQATDPGESAVAGQQITNLDQLLQAVRDEQRRQREVNRKREQQFLQDKRRQQALLEEAIALDSTFATANISLAISIVMQRRDAASP